MTQHSRSETCKQAADEWAGDCYQRTQHTHHHGRYPSGRSCCRCRRHGHVTAASVGVAVRHAGLEQGKARMSVMGRLRPKQEKGSEAQQQSRSGTRRTGVPLIVGGGRLAGGWRRLGAEKVGRRASVEEPLAGEARSPIKRPGTRKATTVHVNLRLQSWSNPGRLSTATASVLTSVEPIAPVVPYSNAALAEQRRAAPRTSSSGTHRRPDTCGRHFVLRLLVHD